MKLTTLFLSFALAALAGCLSTASTLGNYGMDPSTSGQAGASGSAVYRAPPPPVAYAQQGYGYGAVNAYGTGYYGYARPAAVQVSSVGRIMYDGTGSDPNMFLLVRQAEMVRQASQIPPNAVVMPPGGTRH